MVRRIFQHFAREIQAPGEFGLQMYQWISNDQQVVCCVLCLVHVWMFKGQLMKKAQNIRQNPSSWIHHAKVTRVSFSTLLRLLRLFKVILFGTTSSSLTLPAQLACFRNQSSKTLVVYLQQRFADPFAGLLAPA